MKKTIDVCIGERLFTLDNEAYVQMKDYLERIGKIFSGTEGGEEIINDIEARIAELLIDADPEQVKVITPQDVEKIREILGEPSFFAGEKEEGQAHRTANKNSPRRMYRDIDNRILGGVCSGISAYLSVDVVWIRIAMIVLAFFGFGTGVIIYLILWIVIPPAETRLQKLEMSGEPVTISSISDSVRDEFVRIRDKFRK